MGFDEGRITLSSENGAYFSGQTIHGNLVFNQDKNKKFRGIYAKLKGYCKVHWTTQHSRRNNEGKSESYTVQHESYEEYVNYKTFLIGGEKGEVEIQPGSYDFPFKFTLPASCPSSFEGSVGHIRYEIKLVVDRAFKIDQEKKVAVRVIAPLDLNQDPYCREPIQFEFEDTYCCCCMTRGATDTVVKLPMSGYCPGQVMPIEVGCENTGNVEIDDIKLMMRKTVTYHATTNPATRETKDVIAEIKKGPIPGNTTRNWTVEMIVPTIDTYNLATCKYIDIDYDFKVVVSPSGCHSDSKDHKRIVIGNIPLVGYQDNVPNPLQHQMPQINAPIVNQPVLYPGNTPYPTPAYPKPYPDAPTTYPQYPQDQNNSHVPYPNAQNPQQNMFHPTYPQTSPYPQEKTPSHFPSPNLPNPYPNTQTPYPVTPQTMMTPANPPHPQTSPYPQDDQNRARELGFTMPKSMPMGRNSPSLMPEVTPLNPYATASAPPGH